MREISGNMWDYVGNAILVITTNGKITHDGKAVLGNTCAREAGERYPNLAARLGKLLREKENRVFYLGDGIVSFPVEESPWELSGINLIRRSAKELRDLADREGWTQVVLPPPGCGSEGLVVPEVRAVLASFLDDRFLIIVAKG